MHSTNLEPVSRVGVAELEVFTLIGVVCFVTHVVVAGGVTLGPFM